MGWAGVPLATRVPGVAPPPMVREPVVVKRTSTPGSMVRTGSVAWATVTAPVTTYGLPVRFHVVLAVMVWAGTVVAASAWAASPRRKAVAMSSMAEARMERKLAYPSGGAAWAASPSHHLEPG